MGTPEANKRLVLRAIEALNSGDLEAVERLTHVDCYDHETADARPGDGRRRRAASSRRPGAGAAARFEPLDIVAEGDRVVVRGRLVGETPAQAIHIWRLVEGLIVEHWACTDDVDIRTEGRR